MAWKMLAVLALTTLMAWLLFDFVKSIAKLMLIPFKSGICPTCDECKDKGVCNCLTIWFEEDCIRQRIRCGLFDNNQHC